jgi:hypothetical protein
MSTKLPSPVLSVSDHYEPLERNITFHTGPCEMLKVTGNGFYVRGVRVPADEKEAEAVYKAFKQFLVYHALTKEY